MYKFSNLYKHEQSTFSPNGTYIASVVDQKRLVIRSSTLDLPVLHVYECLHPIQHFQWSPNSKHLLTVNYTVSIVQLWSLVDMYWSGTILDESFGIRRVWWSADSSSILCNCSFKLRISVWMLLDQQVRYIRNPKFQDKGCEASPDGKYMAIVENRDGKDYIGIYTPSGTTLLKHFMTDTNDLTNIRWSPNSYFIAVWDMCLFYKLLVYRLDGTLHASYQAYEDGLGIKSVAWSADSRLLAIGSYDQNVRILRTCDWTPISELFHPSTLDQRTQKSALVCQEDAKAPTTCSETIDRVVSKRPFTIPTLRPEYTPNPKIGIGYCQFNCNGKFLCSREDSMPNTIWIWDTSRLECCMIVLQQQTVKQLAWHPHNPYTLAISCGNRNVYLTERGVDGIFKLGPVPVPAADFGVRKLSWSQDGNSLLLADTALYCLARHDVQ